MDIRAKTMTIEQRKEKLLNLVNNFLDNYKYYKTSDFDESNTRLMFIDPLFECLGWDIKNEKGARPDRREVITEDRVIITGETKFPDYVFCYGGERKFFVEAKKPAIDIKNHPEPARQVRRYAYTAKLPISILTDFEEFSIYDTRIKPTKDDDPSKARIFYCRFDNYLENFDKLYKWISWEAIDLGSFDTYTEEAKDKKGTTQVDDDILNLIDEWRSILAEDIAKHNDIDVFNLNTAVQKIIDRIIFLRIAEDKQIEDYGKLKSTLEKKTVGQSIYNRLCNLFEKANELYNAGLFSTDAWLDNLHIEDKTLSIILSHLYYPECPYEFSVLPVEILGSIYEKFLGKVIQFTRKTKSGHSIEIEDKPEVQKAGGVYYTPRYIVKYIVDNTIGIKINGMTPEEVSQLRFVDPACGSGSFLVGAYQFLLDWHLDYYYQEKNKIKAEKQNKIYFDELAKCYKLSIEEKKNILLNNIYGVDIDAQAVEVTKLSLFLKLLEDEGKKLANKHGQVNLFRESDFKILPTLNDNIKCGNSLIETDYYNDKDLSLFGIEEQRKVNVFNWKDEFSNIFKNGGFDCVIGNPPYFNIQTLGYASPEAQYIQYKNKDIWQDKSDILFYFIHKAIQISKGNIGYIISNAFLFADKAQKLRNMLINSVSISRIINFEQYMVFKGASITTCLLFLEHKNYINTQVLTLPNKNYSQSEINLLLRDESNFLNVQLTNNSVFALVDNTITKINSKIDEHHKKLGEVCFVGKGMETAANNVYSFKNIPSDFPKEYLKKRMSGDIISKYFIDSEKEYVLFFENTDDFNDLPEIIRKHLISYKGTLVNRATVKNEGRIWWKYARPMHKDLYKYDKIWTSYRSKQNTFALDTSGEFIGFTNTTVIFGTNTELSLKYILALLNSRLLNFRYKSIGKQTGSGVYEYFENGVSKLPIPTEHSSANYDIISPKLISLADQMMVIQGELAKAISEADKKLFKTQAAILDKQIDTLVYKLYGLTEDEIKIVDGH